MQKRLRNRLKTAFSLYRFYDHSSQSTRIYLRNHCIIQAVEVVFFVVRSVHIWWRAIHIWCSNSMNFGCKRVITFFEQTVFARHRHREQSTSVICTFKDQNTASSSDITRYIYRIFYRFAT